MRGRLSQIVVDCRDPRTLARFWAQLLGGEPVDRGHGWSHVEPPGFVRLAFQLVPEARTIKNRLHLDIAIEDVELACAEVERLGGRRLGAPVTDEQGTFQVVQDAEGNEFCFIQD